jgi:hypothetical protein
MRGEDGHMHYYFGKAKGLLFMPNWAGKPVVDERTGQLKYIHKADKQGNLMYDNNGNPIYVNELANITEKDGDWLIVTRIGGFFTGKDVLVRAARQLVSPIGEEIWIKTVNLMPVGDFYYPHQQWQSDIIRINMQSLAEAVEETHMRFLDLAATTTESSLRSDPNFVKLMQVNSENITNKESSAIQQLGK